MYTQQNALYEIWIKTTYTIFQRCHFFYAFNMYMSRGKRIQQVPFRLCGIIFHRVSPALHTISIPLKKEWREIKRRFRTETGWERKNVELRLGANFSAPEMRKKRSGREKLRNCVVKKLRVFRDVYLLPANLHVFRFSYNINNDNIQGYIYMKTLIFALAKCSWLCT